MQSLHDSIRITAVATAALALAGCAGSGASGTPEPEALTRDPVLIRCIEPVQQSSHGLSGSRVDRVTLQFLVTDEGRVEESSVQVLRTSRSTTRASIEEATARAVSCTYLPARRGSTLIPATTERTFRVLTYS